MKAKENKKKSKNNNQLTVEEMPADANFTEEQKQKARKQAQEHLNEASNLTNKNVKEKYANLKADVRSGAKSAEEAINELQQKAGPKVFLDEINKKINDVINKATSIKNHALTAGTGGVVASGTMYAYPSLLSGTPEQAGFAAAAFSLILYELTQNN